MPRKEFEMIVASAPRESLAFTRLDQTGVNIPPGQQQAFNIFAPVGVIGRVQSVYLGVPKQAGAASGNIDVVLGCTGSSGSFMESQTSYNTDLSFARFSYVTGGDLYKLPSDMAAVVAAIKDIQFDSVIGLAVIITNNLNVAYTNNFSFYVNWIQREVY